MFLRVFGGSNGSFIWRGYAWDSWWAVTSGGIWHPNGMSLDLRQDFTSIAVAKWWALKMWTCWTPFYHISTFFHDFNQVLLSAIVIAHHLMDLHDIVQMDCKTFGPSFGQLISCDGRHSTKKNRSGFEDLWISKSILSSDGSNKQNASFDWSGIPEKNCLRGGPQLPVVWVVCRAMDFETSHIMKLRNVEGGDDVDFNFVIAGQLGQLSRAGHENRGRGGAVGVADFPACQLTTGGDSKQGP